MIGAALRPLDTPFSDSSEPLRCEELECLCLRNLLGAQQERLFFKDLDGRFLLVSEGWLAAEGQGRSLDSVVGKTDFDIFSRPHAIAALEDEQRVIRTGQPMFGKVERETFNDRPDEWVSTTKFPLRDQGGQIIGTFGIARDVTAQMHDGLTGLANRVALMDRLAQALVTIERRPAPLAVLFLDVDGFKRINDAFGHRAGDEVLVEVAHRLARLSRRLDTVARYGGDEFAMLCTSLNSTDDLRLIARRVIASICQPVDVDDEPIGITGSLGAVITSNPMADPDTLLDQADAAMYEAKRAGNGRFHIHVDSTTDESTSASRRPAGTDPLQ